MILMFGVFSALFVTSYIFFSNEPVQDPVAQYKHDQNYPVRDYQVMHVRIFLFFVTIFEFKNCINSNYYLKLFLVKNNR